MCEEIKIFITWVLVILGWGVVHYLSAKRDRNKELRALCLTAITYIEEIEREAIRYHTGIERDVSCEKKIRKDLQRLDTIVETILKPLGGNKITVVQLRQAITRNNFATCQFFSQQTLSPITFEINAEAESLAILLLQLAYK